ncbi:unnamed protein product [Vicia faba]|uniref:Aluminum-activated malate transporter 10 n=1 Tax=Vicia faba TaxID=3906 RepID=A0AAV0ZXS0_VICFA|nr:unnamed protein product [Vicia faba]
MTNDKGVAKEVEWRIKVEDESLDIGVNDPRKFIHCLKVGIALTAVSLFYYLKPLYDGVGRNAMWAVMTVIVVFEYTAGATIYKSINRICGTTLAGLLAFGVHWVASRAGDQWEPIIVGVSLFLLASAATFSRFIPTIKARFDYGAMIFILTFCLVSSPETSTKLANSLQGCVAQYFEAQTATEESNKKIMGYKCVLNSKATEESLANLARWEPAHGRFNFCHPWKQYLKIGATMRRCASCVDALIGCIHSENKSSNDIRKIMSKTSMQVGDNSANVLRELALTIRNMTKSNKLDILVMEMNSAAQELQNLLKSYPNTQNNEDAKMEIPIMDIIQVVTMVSLLTEIVARVEDIVNCVEELSSLGKYKPAVSMCDKSKQHSTDNKISPEQQNEEEAIVKTLQMV